LEASIDLAGELDTRRIARRGTAACGRIRVPHPLPVHTVLAELLPRFERTAGHRIAATREPSAAIIARLAGGESARQTTNRESASSGLADAVVLTSHAIDGEGIEVLPGIDGQCAGLCG